MERDLIVLRAYSSPVEADLVRNILNDAGVVSYLGDDALVGMFWHLGNAVGGVKVLIDRQDLQRAFDALDDAEADPNDDPQDAWACGECGAEVEGHFDLCWSCEAPRSSAASIRPARPQAPRTSAQQPPSRQPRDSFAPATEPSDEPDDQDPYRSPRLRLPDADLDDLADDEPSADDSYSTDDEPSSDDLSNDALELPGDVQARRAWRAAVLGWWLLPPLVSLYAVWLVLDASFHGAPRSPSGDRDLRWAWGANLAAALAWGVLVSLIFRMV